MIFHVESFKSEVISTLIEGKGRREEDGRMQGGEGDERRCGNEAARLTGCVKSSK